MGTGRTTALARAVNWGTLGYALIGHMVDRDEKAENTLLTGLTVIISYELNNMTRFTSTNKHGASFDVLFAAFQPSNVRFFGGKLLFCAQR